MTAQQLSERLERYLVLRRSLGFPMKQEERLLRDFVQGVGSPGPGPQALAEVALSWACSSAKRCGPGGASRRLSIARGFLTYLRGLDAHVTVPPPQLLPGGMRPVPHIYSPAELASLMAAARCLGPRGSLRPYTMEALIGLVASCGLRAREALHLRLEDVVLSGALPHLRIAETKFHKSRLVPVHDSTAAALASYVKMRGLLSYDGLCDTFFVSERAGPLVYGSVADTFRSLTRRVGLREVPGQRDARFHDLRHTFAVMRMLAWYREGVDVQARLPELSVYMGHVHPQDTYWYLTATPALLEAAAGRFEAFACQGEQP